MFHLGRRALFSTFNLLAFDQFELYQVKEGTGPVTDDTKTTSEGTVVTDKEPTTDMTTTLDIQSTNEKSTTELVTTLESQPSDSSSQKSSLSSSSASSTTSTTTSSSSTMSTSPSSMTSTNEGSMGQLVKVLGCSFDKTDPLCDLVYQTNGTTHLYSVFPFSSQIAGSYKVTDFTSISKLFIAVFALVAKH